MIESDSKERPRRRLRPVYGFILAFIFLAGIAFGTVSILKNGGHVPARVQEVR